MIKSIAALITCYNRREKTLNCLKALFEANLPSEYSLYVFLVDDGSIDGTGEAVKAHFPQVNITRGNGKLFWNQGMRLAWKTAAKNQKFDFYFWLNDDTFLDKHAFNEFFDCYTEAIIQDKRPAIIAGACRVSSEIDEFAYGGRTDTGPVTPNGTLQFCKSINGNAVIIPKEIFQTIGNLSSDYTHALGDIDYGLRALNASFKSYTTKNYIAVCPKNGIPAWCNPSTPFKKRLQLLYTPKGLNIKEYNTFRKKFWGSKWLYFAIKAYMKAFSPIIYSKISSL